MASDLEREMGTLLDRYIFEKPAHNLDFILAHFLKRCLEAWHGIVHDLVSAGLKPAEPFPEHSARITLAPLGTEGDEETAGVPA